MTTAIEKASLWSWCEEPNYLAPLRATGPGTLAGHAALDDNAERFTATGAGSTTTIVCSALTEASAAGYRLLLVRCIGVANPATNGENVGIWVLVRSSDGAGTLTTTAFPAATATGDQFEAADIDARVTDTTGGGTAIVFSTRRATVTNEPDDFWNGYYLVAESAFNNPQGTTTLISDFQTATGRFDVATVGLTVLGDAWWLRKFPKTMGAPTIEWTIPDIPRPSNTPEIGEEQTVPGERSWSSEWAIALKGSGSAAGAGVTGVAPPELDPPLRSVFTKTSSVGSTVVAASGAAPALSTTSFNVATGGMTNHPVGTFVHDNAGCTAIVTAQAANGGDPDSLTLRPPLNRTPIAGEVMRGSVCYSPKRTGHKTMTVDCILGGKVRFLGFGGLPTVKITNIKKGAIPQMVLGYRGGLFVTYPLDTPSPLVAQQDTLIPKSAADCYVQIGAEGSNTFKKLVVDEGSIDYGHAIVEVPGVSLVDGTHEMRITAEKITGRLVCSLDTDATVNDRNTYQEYLRYLASRVFTLKWQHHSMPGRTVSWYAHRCAYVAPEFPTANGYYQIVLNFEVLKSELSGMGACVLGVT